MIFSYYPGCTLKNKAQDLDRYARASAEKLGVTLQELENWQCCGGAFSMGKDEIASKLASVRALNAAKEQGQDLVTLCSACHNVLKQANDAMANDAEFSDHANNYMQLDQPYRGETKVIHYLELLRDVVGFENVKKAVVNPLKGRKIAAYYGCLLLRPGKVMQMDNPENPRIMEDFIRAIGAEPVLWANRNECCGGYAVMEDKKIAQKKSTAVMENAADMQADTLVTACPLCLYNLTKNASGEHRLPVVYFTELLAEALDIFREARGADILCAFVRHAGRPEETRWIGRLADLPADDVDMSTLVLIGSARTVTDQGALFEARGYAEKYLDKGAHASAADGR